MRLLFVHEVSYLEKVVFEMHDFPELLSRRGHEITFVDYPEGRSRQGLRRLVDLRTEEHRGVARAHEGASVRVRTPGRVLPPPFDRPLASLTQVPEIHRQLRTGHFDAVVLYGVPTNGWQTVHLARRAGVPVLFRAIDVSHLLRDVRVGALIERAERFIYRSADAISTHNDALRRYCIANGAAADRVSIEYPGLDLERFRPGPRDPDLAASVGIEPDDEVIVFMGTLYRFAGLEGCLTELAPLLRDHPRRKLLVIGGGERADSIRDQARTLGLDDRVLMPGPAGYDVLAPMLRLGDVAINPFDTTTVTHCALPGKALQYLGCGLPTVSTPLEGLMSAFADGEGVRYAPVGPEFAAAVESLLEDRSERQALAERGLAALRDRFDWDRCLDAFESAVERVTR